MQVGTVLPWLPPLWSNLQLQACQTWFREDWLQLWHKEMVRKYQLKSWGIDWRCWRVATLNVHSVHLKLEIFCYPPRGEDCSAAGIATAELWFRSSSGKSALDFSPFLLSSQKYFWGFECGCLLPLPLLELAAFLYWRISSFGDIHV